MNHSRLASSFGGYSEGSMVLQARGFSAISGYQGGILNAVMEQLLHNLRKQRIPERYVAFIESMLMGRRNRLTFDDFVSDWFHLDNSTYSTEGPLVNDTLPLL